MKTSWIAASFLSLALALPAAAADYTIQPEVTSLAQTPHKMIIFGNSYTYYNCGLFDYLWGFAGDQKVDLQTQMATIAGADLDWHNIATVLNPPGTSADFVFPKDNKAGHRFDTVLLQGNSLAPVHPKMKDNYRQWAAKHVQTICANNAQPAFIITWARPGQPEMTQQLAGGTIAVANENKALAIPVGLAFAAVQRAHPEITLIMPDKSHPTAAGSYLASAVIYSAVTHKSLEGTHFLGGCEKPLQREVAANLQNAAWETVKSFYHWR